jgi:sugar O-acyltransferase (sialic acid O-acetyltransferase NeuD family)
MSVRSARHPERLLIFPCNGNGIEALDCLGDAYRFAGFVDDAVEKQGTTRFGHPVRTRDVRSRRGVIEGLRLAEKRFARVIHPAARVSPQAAIGHNVLIMAGVVVTSDAVIGNHVCILPNTVIHHGAVVGDFCLIGSNVTIAGDAAIGDNAYVGSGSSLMNGIRIGDGALIGLGSNVIRNVAPGTTVAGNPAAPLR